MKGFQIKGTFNMAGEWTRFTKEVAADDEAGAREALFSDLGSRHGVTRRAIQIKTVVPVKAEDLTNLVVRYRVGAK